MMHTRGAIRGFTLIELLVVISIIGVLVTLGVGGTALIIDQAKKAKTKSTIQMLEMALSQYKGDFGIYPDDDPPEYPFNVLTGYQNSPEEPDPSITQRPDWHGPYLKISSLKEFEHRERNKRMVDPWMQPYHLRLNKPECNRFGVDIWSSGPNMKDEGGKGDDITNWK
jgi:type II secretion system protein G